MDNVNRVLQGDLLATARLLRQVDNDLPEAREQLKQLYRHTGRAYVLGITGTPGAGKSTLTDCLITSYRADGKTVGVLAIDPTSPFSGGAILGDRIRMQHNYDDDGVFIRSLATRGQLGGLTRTTKGAITVMDAMGKDIIIVETVGVGQDEVDVARAAHSTIIVMTPGQGDEVQAMKAGIMEIADIFVVNKSDQAGADSLVRDIQTVIGMEGQTEWIPLIVKTVAARKQGIEGLRMAITSHRTFLEGRDSESRNRTARRRAEAELMDLVIQNVTEVIRQQVLGSSELGNCVTDLIDRRADPYSLSEQIVAKVLK